MDAGSDQAICVLPLPRSVTEVTSIWLVAGAVVGAAGAALLPDEPEDDVEDVDDVEVDDVDVDDVEEAVPFSAVPQAGQKEKLLLTTPPQLVQ